MTPELKVACDNLAKTLHKIRTEKTERITANTVIRCLIEAGLSSFSLEAGEHANSEAELLQLVKSKFGR